MPDARRPHHEGDLNQFWNVLVQGTAGGSAEAGALDLDTAEALRVLQALGTDPVPAASRERVRARLLGQLQGLPTQDKESLMNEFAMLDLTRSGMGHNGRGITAFSTPPAAPVLDRAARPPRWFSVGHVALAALLLLCLAVSMLAVGVFRQHGDEGVGVPAVLPAVQPDPVAFVWSTTGDPDQPLDDPSYPAFDPQGNLWVPDGRNSRFQIIAPDGALLEVWGAQGSAEGQFNFLEAGFGGYGQGAITFDAAGNFYVVDTGNYRIQKFGPDRRFLTAWGSKGTGNGQFEGPTDVAVDGQGRVFVVDAARGDPGKDALAIQVFDADGAFLAAWGDRGTGAGQMVDPSGLAIAQDGTVWVADFGNHRIQHFTPDGALLTEWGGSGSKAGQFFNPTDVAVDVQGRIWVSDWQNRRVQVLEPDGTLVAAWGEAGKIGEGLLLGPNSLVLDGAGFVYVADVGRDTVLKYRLLPPLAP